MKTTSVAKRITAVSFCIALLCCTLCGISFLPAVAEETPAVYAVDRYRVDFADLAAMVDADAFGTNGRYQSTMMDTEINEWANDRFALVFNREDKTPLASQKNYLGQGSFTLRSDHNSTAENTQGDSWGSSLYWEIDKNGYLYHNTGTNHGGGEVARKGDALTLKTADGALAQLTNAEVRVVFNSLGNEKGMVYIALHEATPGYYPFNGKTKTSDILGIAKDNNSTGLLSVLKGDTTGFHNGHDGELTVANKPHIMKDFTGMTTQTDYEFYLKAVGTTFTVRLTEVATGKVLYEETRTNALTADNGYISVGTTRTDRAIKSIEVVELNAEGNPIDFGSNTTNVETFDFSVRDIIARNGGKYTATAGAASNANANWFTFYDGAAHAETADAAIVKSFMDSKFAFFYNSENIYGPEQAGQWKAYEGQTSDMAAFGQLYDGMWLQREFSSNYKENFRLVSAMVPRGDNGELLQMKNFETSFMVSYDGYSSTSKHEGSVIVGFRQQTPGKFVDRWYSINKEQGFASITRTGVTVAAGNDIISGSGVTGDMYNHDTTWSYDDPSTGTCELLPYSFYVVVKVVGDKCWLTLYQTDKTTVIWNNDGNPLPINYDKNGYIAYGIGSKKASIADIHLTRLDDEGNPIDIDNNNEVNKFTFDPKYIIPYNAADYKYPAKVNNATNNWYEFTGGTAMNAQRIAKTLDEKFAMYYNWDHFYTQVEPAAKTAFEWQDTKEYPSNVTASNYGWFAQVYNNRWLQRFVRNENGAETMRLVSSLVPRSAITGEELKFRNFETTFAVDFEHKGHHQSTVAFGFRQQTPGKFTDGYYQVNKKQAFVTVSYQGVTVAAGAAIDNQAYNKDLTYTFPENIRTREIRVTVKAVGNQCWVTVAKTDGTVMFDNGGQPFTIDYDCEGYIAYGIGSTQASLGAISLTRLDDEGNPIDIETAVVPSPTERVALVKTVAGKELKAGSLLAKDAEGNLYIPQRNGFRQGGNADEFILTPGSTIVAYEFITPSLETPNIGNVGNSYNESANGLRFTGRFYRQNINNVDYIVTTDGTKYEVTDYGVLLSSAPGLRITVENLEDDTAVNEAMVIGSDNAYVKAYSNYATGMLFDACDDYLDIALSVINIDKIRGYENPLAIDFYARPYVTVLVDGNATTLYGDTTSASFEDVLS